MMFSYLRQSAISFLLSEFFNFKTLHSLSSRAVSHIRDSIDLFSAEAILNAVSTDGCRSVFFPFVIVEYGTSARDASIFKVILR